MKTLIIVSILATIIAFSNAVFLFGNGGWLGGGNQRHEAQEHLHHHHHHHEVVHKSLVAAHHPEAVVKLVHTPVEVHPQHVQFYKIIHEQAPQHHGEQGHQLGYGHIEGGHGPAYHQEAPHVITKVVQPIVHKNFIHNQHEHHYHHIASAPAHHHGWD